MNPHAANDEGAWGDEPPLLLRVQKSFPSISGVLFGSVLKFWIVWCNFLLSFEDFCFVSIVKKKNQLPFAFLGFAGDGSSRVAGDWTGEEAITPLTLSGFRGGAWTHVPPMTATRGETRRHCCCGCGSPSLQFLEFFLGLFWNFELFDVIFYWVLNYLCFVNLDVKGKKRKRREKKEKKI